MVPRSAHGGPDQLSGMCPARFAWCVRQQWSCNATHDRRDAV